MAAFTCTFTVSDLLASRSLLTRGARSDTFGVAKREREKREAREANHLWLREARFALAEREAIPSVMRAREQETKDVTKRAR